MLRQIQRIHQFLPPSGAVFSAAQAGCIEIGFFDFGLRVMFDLVDRRAGAPQRRQQDLGRHPFHAELSLAGGMRFSFLFARHIRDIGVFDETRIYAALEEVSDHKAGSVGIGQHDKTAFFSQRAKKLQLLTLVEDAKAFRLQDHGIQKLAELVFIVSPLHQDDFTDLMHGSPPPQCAIPALSAAPEVMMPIMIEETTSEIATKAIST